MNPKLPSWIAGATHSQLARFAWAVDVVMDADDLAPNERKMLIAYWAYKFERPDMPEQLLAAIARFQSTEWVRPTATSVVDKLTGEVLAYNPG